MQLNAKHDGFGYADSFDAEAGRYRGLVLHDTADKAKPTGVVVDTRQPTSSGRPIRRPPRATRGTVGPVAARLVATETAESGMGAAAPLARRSRASRP
jgi:hypothetical protein